MWNGNLCRFRHPTWTRSNSFIHRPLCYDINHRRSYHAWWNSKGRNSINRYFRRAAHPQLRGSWKYGTCETLNGSWLSLHCRRRFQGSSICNGSRSHRYSHYSLNGWSGCRVKSNGNRSIKRFIRPQSGSPRLLLRGFHCRTNIHGHCLCEGSRRCCHTYGLSNHRSHCPH